MVHEEKLSSVLSEFARTLATDFPIQAILDHLVERIVEVLPITGAGVTLISVGVAPHYVAASDEFALVCEQLQTEIGEGPCLLAFDTGKAVTVANLGAEDRFPLFTPAARNAGLAAVFTFPLHHGDKRLGALDLYRDVPGELDAPALAAAQTLADVATAYLLNARAREEALSTTERFRHDSLHDPLTGLPNRLLLQQRLEHAAQRARRSRTDAAILFADLDRFKAVNDTYGHQVGDELLLAVARRLAALVRPGDTLARVSGDEFVFLCEDLHSPDDVVLLARRIEEAFGRPFPVAGRELSVTASVGVAFAGPGGDISDELVVKADIAMYRAKRRGGAGHHIIDLREALQSSNRDSLETDLQVAFAHGDLELAYQPIVCSSTGRISGVEALLRWTHPSRGKVSPLLMVQVAEQSELIIDIGAWVLERACSDRAQWLVDEPDTPLDLAVNVSARQLMSRDFVATVQRALSQSGMDPHSLVLEMTETIFIEDGEQATAALREISALGVRLALDDFGTGFSSLSYLRRLPIDIVKVDQGFIADIGQASTGGAIVAAVTHLAHVLGLAVIAEGVETEEQRDEITVIGCDFAQGYFFARPMPAAGIGEWLASSQLGAAGLA